VFGDEKGVSGTKHDVVTPGTPVCVNCHIPHEAGADVLWAAKPNTSGPFAGLRPLCFSCHDGTVTTIGTFAFDLSRPLHLRSSGVRGADCDRCHDVHGTQYAKFLKLPGGADFCRNCHEKAGPVNHPVDVNARALGVDPTDSTWNPYKGDFSGTRLWNADGTGPGDYVKCLSCHATHGGTPGTQFNTMPLGGVLCQNCHKK
jgi:predicted CXXCH cytochrome family protein